MNCKWIQVILLLVIAVFSMFVKSSASTWIVFIAALALLAHALWCKSCNACWSGDHGMKATPAKKKK